MRKSFDRIPILSDPEPYTPNLNDNTNVSTNAAMWWRIGGHMFVQGLLSYSNSGSGAGLTLGLPDKPRAFSIDLKRLGSGTATIDQTNFGTFNYLDAGTNFRTGSVCYGTTTTIVFVPDSGGGAYANTQFAGGDRLHYWFMVPIDGWRSNRRGR